MDNIHVLRDELKRMDEDEKQRQIEHYRQRALLVERLEAAAKAEFLYSLDIVMRENTEPLTPEQVEAMQYFERGTNLHEQFEKGWQAGLDIIENGEYYRSMFSVPLRYAYMRYLKHHKQAES